MIKKVAIICPLDLRRRPTELISRLKNLSKAVINSEFTIIIGHADRGSKFDLLLKKLAESFDEDDVKLISTTSTSKAVNLSHLRNTAVMVSPKVDSLILLDIDIYPDLNLLRALVRDLTSSSISMAPCIYLTKEGSKRILEKENHKVLESILSFSPKYFMHWALPSSVIAVSKSDFLELGGFSEEYQGHGYEDFDFMIKLAVSKQLIPNTSELLIDRPYKAPLLAEGFRGELATLAIENLIQGNIAFHLFHKKNKKEAYYLNRDSNAAIFKQRISNLNLRSDKPLIPNVLQKFYSECYKHNVDPNKYHALFDARPRYLLRSKFSLKSLFT